MTDPKDTPAPVDRDKPAVTPVAPKRTTFFPSLTEFKAPKEGAPKLPVRVMCFQVLQAAGEDPWAWSRQFVDTSFKFLGRRFTGGLHEVLSTHLREKETALISFAKKLNEQENGPGAPDISAFEAGTILGLAGPVDFPQGIPMRGARKVPTSAPVSMHLFGLAVDFDFDLNFYPETAGRTSLTNVLQKARLLFESADAPEEKPDVPWGWPQAGKKANGDIIFKNLEYDEVAQLNRKVLQYAALLVDNVALTAFLTLAKAEPWSDLDVEGANKLIEKHLEDFCSTLKRKPLEEVVATVKKTGFMTIPKKLHEELDLDWGGAYGDVMHYDGRNLARGRKIQRKIQAFKDDDATQKALRERWKSFEGKTEAEMLPEFLKAYPK
jgi:hypothetical protein